MVQQPDGTENIIGIEHIFVSSALLESTPSEKKIKPIREFYEKNGYLDEPLLIKTGSLALQNSYARYYFAKQIGLEYVPVRYME